MEVRPLASAFVVRQDDEGHLLELLVHLESLGESDGFRLLVKWPTVHIGGPDGRTVTASPSVTMSDGNENGEAVFSFNKQMHRFTI